MSIQTVTFRVVREFGSQLAEFKCGTGACCSHSFAQSESRQHKSLRRNGAGRRFPGESVSPHLFRETNYALPPFKQRALTLGPGDSVPPGFRV